MCGDLIMVGSFHLLSLWAPVNNSNPPPPSSPSGHIPKMCAETAGKTCVKNWLLGREARNKPIAYDNWLQMNRKKAIIKHFSYFISGDPCTFLFCQLDLVEVKLSIIR